MKKFFVTFLVAIMMFSCLASVSANAESPIKDYAMAQDGELLYTLNFSGDDSFAPDIIGIKSSANHTVGGGGTTLTIENPINKEGNYWGGTISGLEFSKETVYTMKYKVSSSQSDTLNNSVGIGGLFCGDENDLYSKNPPFYNNYSNHGVTNVDDVRSSISFGGAKIKDTDGKAGDYVYWKNLSSEIKKDSLGYVELMSVLDNNELVQNAVVL